MTSSNLVVLPIFPRQQAGGDDDVEFVEYLYAIGLAERTITVYRRAVDRFVEWCSNESINPDIVTGRQLAEYASFIPMTHASRRQHRVALRHWYDMQGLAPALEAIRVPPRKRGVSKALEPWEASALAAAALGVFPQGLAVLLGLYLGLRREEIAKTRWDRFSHDLAWYTVLGKNDLEATIPVHPVVAGDLPRRTAYVWLFPGRSSAHVRPETVTTWIAQIARDAKVDGVHPHRLRHTAIATVNDVTGDLRAAQEFARHADISTTQRYTRVGRDRLLRAVAALNYLDRAG